MVGKNMKGSQKKRAEGRRYDRVGLRWGKRKGSCSENPWTTAANRAIADRAAKYAAGKDVGKKGQKENGERCGTGGGGTSCTGGVPSAAEKRKLARPHGDKVIIP